MRAVTTCPTSRRVPRGRAVYYNIVLRDVRCCFDKVSRTRMSTGRAATSHAGTTRVRAAPAVAVSPARPSAVFVMRPSAYSGYASIRAINAIHAHVLCCARVRRGVPSWAPVFSTVSARAGSRRAGGSGTRIVWKIDRVRGPTGKHVGRIAYRCIRCVARGIVRVWVVGTPRCRPWRIDG